MLTRVLSVFMPFSAPLYPSLSLSLFHARFLEMGIPHKILYFNILFAKRLGAADYFALAEDYLFTYGNFLGEWLFSGEVFPQSPDSIEEYLRIVSLQNEQMLRQSPGAPSERDPLTCIREARATVPGFLDDCVADILRRRPRVVGFSSMFQQHLASLALAKRLKSASPETFIVFGGANCEKIRGIETLRNFPFVDAVILGEADTAYPDLADGLLKGRDISGIPGVYLRNAVPSFTEDRECGEAHGAADMDELPIPDFSDYFEALEPIRKDIEAIPNRLMTGQRLLLETSRGCWWREGGGCNFCHQASPVVRKKSPERAYSEIVRTLERYPGVEIEFTDNAMPLEYFDSLLQMLGRLTPRARLTYYLRTTVTKKQVQTLRDAGLIRILPGIETLNDGLLRALNKGTSLFHNIQILKWCREFGIEAGWNLLWGIPGETLSAYEEMIALLPLLSHLQPPFGFTPVYLGRFSNYYERPEQFGIMDIAPADAYSSIYPFDRETVSRLALYFRFHAPTHADSYLPSLTAAVSAWKQAHSSSRLDAVETSDGTVVLDTRPGALRAVHRFSRLQSGILGACEAGCNFSKMRTDLGEYAEGDIRDEIEALIVMTVDPGFSGQTMDMSVMPKLSRISAMIQEAGAATDLEIDGGVEPENVHEVVKRGGNVLVAGAGVYAKSDPVAAIATLREKAAEASRGQ